MLMTILNVELVTVLWFARDVTAAMLDDQNKSISLLWELNSIFMQILKEKLVIQHDRLVTWLETKNSKQLMSKYS